jgi:hypothetical protein
VAHAVSVLSMVLHSFFLNGVFRFKNGGFFFKKIAEEISITRSRPWYLDLWLQFCRSNIIFGLLKYAEVPVN